MNIAITGHTAGIGCSLARRMTDLGHTVIGISKREGNNIRNVPKILQQIEPCDFWINNAQAGYAQTELLYRVWEAWRGRSNKMIWLISTMMTQDVSVPVIPGMTDVAVAEYKNQKRALEDAFYQLRPVSFSPAMMLIRPGCVATQPEQIPDQHGADVDKWVDTLVDFYLSCQSNNLWPEEISLGFKKDIICL
jgi:NAD(P)-dependent dehydrogenase (short-subunit alcohol dehydrogenase family)